jgi:hypothetical protein
VVVRPSIGRCALVPALRAVTGPLNRTAAEAKTEESIILVLARNGHHIPGLIRPKSAISPLLCT